MKLFATVTALALVLTSTYASDQTLAPVAPGFPVPTPPSVVRDLPKPTTITSVAPDFPTPITSGLVTPGRSTTPRHPSVGLGLLHPTTLPSVVPGFPMPTTAVGLVVPGLLKPTTIPMVASGLFVPTTRDPVAPGLPKPTAPSVAPGFPQPALPLIPKPGACVSGTMVCGGDFVGGFTVCNFGAPVSFRCAPGTKCHPNGNHIICNR